MDESNNVPDYEPPTYEEVIGDGPQIAYIHSPRQSCLQCERCSSHFNLGSTSTSTSDTPIVRRSSTSDTSFVHRYSGDPGELNQAYDAITEQPTEDVVTSQAESIRIDDYYVRIDDRLVFDFEKITCHHGQRSGLETEVKAHLPLELSERGISGLEWYQWMYQLEQIQNNGPTECGCTMMHCFPGCIVQYIICILCCPLSKYHRLSFLPCCYGDYFEALRNWMTQVNDTLQRHGMYAKLLTYKPFVAAPKSKLYERRTQGRDVGWYEMSFLVIALTSEECTTLQAESWNRGFEDCMPSRTGRCL